MLNTNELQYGLNQAHPCQCAWGARAIYERYQIQCVWDRQHCIGTGEDRAKLAEWINYTALPRMRKFFKDNKIPSDSRYEYRYDDGEYHIIANTNASYGYLYITAYQDYWFDAAGNLKHEISLDDAKIAYHRGKCDEDVARLCEKLNFEVPRNKAISFLESTGGYERQELNAMTDIQLANVVLWVFCGTIVDESRDGIDGWKLCCL